MSDPASPCRAYGPFWAIATVFLALGIVYGFQVRDLWQTRAQLRQSLVQVNPALNQALVVNNTLVQLGNDLLRLAETSPAAREVVQQFNVRRNQPIEPKNGREETKTTPKGESKPSSDKPRR